MEIIRSRLGHENLDAAAEAAVLSVIGVGEQLELAEHLGAGEVEHDAAGLGDDETGAVDEHLRSASAGAGDRQFRGAAGDARHIADEGLGIADAACKQRQGVHETVGEVLPAHRRGGLEQRSFRRYRDGFDHFAELEPEVQVEPLRDADLDVGAAELLEAHLLHRNGVDAHRQAGEHVQAGFRRGRFHTQAGGVIGGDDFGARDQRPVGVGDDPGKRARGYLSRERNHKSREQQKTQHKLQLLVIHR